MTTLTVEVPKSIAKKFATQKVVNYKKLFEELENNSWSDFDVKMSAENFLETLDREVLNHKV